MTPRRVVPQWFLRWFPMGTVTAVVPGPLPLRGPEPLRPVPPAVPQTTNHTPTHPMKGSPMNTPEEHTADMAIGDRVRFHPKPGRTWWIIRARDDRYVVATRQAPFRPKGEQQYTILDLTGYQNRTYNGQGNGIVRSSLNTLGGGYDLGPEGQNCGQILADLASGEWELSHRRILRVDLIEAQR